MQEAVSIDTISNRVQGTYHRTPHVGIFHSLSSADGGWVQIHALITGEPGCVFCDGVCLSNGNMLVAL